jgi:hypothetical protein
LALLLGQTEAASRALSLSQEYEPLAFIREHSQDSPDLLPGLCLYGERWLQSEVFPHFRDLAVLRASLKDYFADEQVQAYLEQLPAETIEPEEWAVVESPAEISPAASSMTAWPQAEQPTLAAATPGNNGAATAIAERVAPSNLATLPERNKPKPANGNRHNSSDRAVPTATRARPSAIVPAESAPSPSNRRPRRSRDRAIAGNSTIQRSQPKPPASGRRNANPKRGRLLLLTGGGILGLGLAGFLFVLAFNGIRGAISGTSGATLEEGQLQIELAQPPLEIPPADAPIVIPDGPLTEDSARQIIQTWLSVKTQALGQEHNIQTLESILAEPLLSLWQARAQKLKESNTYREFDHRIQVESVQMSADNANAAVVEAAVKETAQVYRQGTLNQAASYDDNLRVRYNLVREGERWKIRQMEVID